MEREEMSNAQVVTVIISESEKKWKPEKKELIERKKDINIVFF
ncbi:hypothetical protein [Streptomyces sp. NPDC056056]